MSCDDPTFLASAEREQWSDDSRSGLGIVRTKDWNLAIANTNQTEVSGAPLLTWTADPMKTERDSWNTAWTVECATFAAYLVMVAVYSYVMGYTQEAYPTCRKIIDPNAKELPSRRKIAPKEGK